ncbi:MAG: hypothetical protein V1844_07675 [Pseudomonadota bacterium]
MVNRNAVMEALKNRYNLGRRSNIPVYPSVMCEELFNQLETLAAE